MFDATGEDPVKFCVGAGQVIRGLDEGVLGLKKGQKAIITCPPDYAYGSVGAPGIIPPDATLHFEIQVIEFQQFL